MRHVGLTMRVVRSPEYPEDRDALAQDWARFLGAAIPDCRWMGLPNLGGQAAAHARAWAIDALVFTGGNDLGEAPVRDATEEALLRFALDTGVCRGLQFFQSFHGGPVVPCPRDAHVATRHPVDFGPGVPGPAARVVNSYHARGVRRESLARPLAPFATTPDGWVEGLRHREAPLTAIQWHPERGESADPSDVALFRESLGLSPLREAASLAEADSCESFLTPFTFPPCVR